MYTLRRSKNFESSFKKLTHSGIKDSVFDDFYEAVDTLVLGKKLPPKYKDHPLKGDYLGYRECHIRPDILFIYKIFLKEKILLAYDIGSHSYLFG